MDLCLEEGITVVCVDEFLKGELVEVFLSSFSFFHAFLVDKSQGLFLHLGFLVFKYYISRDNMRVFKEILLKSFQKVYSLDDITCKG